MRRALLVIAKRPAAGQTKTRLCPPLSGVEAANLYECMLRDTLETARTVPGVELLIAYAPTTEAAYFRQLAPGFELVPQIGNDLGERLDNVLTHCLTNGYQQAVIMDSDSPTLPAANLMCAFQALDDADVVLGPCDDGGYYLIGLTQPRPRLLREVAMSTAHVLEDTLALARQDALRVGLLPAWYDVDTVSELTRLQTELHALPNGQAQHTRAFFLRGI
jgi:hypothetical protein